MVELSDRASRDPLDCRSVVLGRLAIRELASKNLVPNYPKRPDICTFVDLKVELFWTGVSECSSKPRIIALSLSRHRSTQVQHLEGLVAIMLNAEEVVGLNVAVDQTVTV
jgi:hypothetical protein